MNVCVCVCDLKVNVRITEDARRTRLSAALAEETVGAGDIAQVAVPSARAETLTRIRARTVVLTRALLVTARSVTTCNINISTHKYNMFMVINDALEFAILISVSLLRMAIVIAPMSYCYCNYKWLFSYDSSLLLRISWHCLTVNCVCFFYCLFMSAHSPDHYFSKYTKLFIAN